MSKVTKIHTNFILEVEHNDIEYHVTISDDLKDIFDIDVVNVDVYSKKYKEVIGSTEMGEIIWEAFMNKTLDLDE